MKRYVEIDFPHMTSLKAQRISRSASLRQAVAPDPKAPYTVSRGGTQLSGDRYTLLPLDLRDDPSTTLAKELLPILDTGTPTLFLAECVLCYLQPKVGEEILRWFSDTFGSCMGVIYEMCGLE